MAEAVQILQNEIQSFIREGCGEFADLALRIFHHQLNANPPYRAYCESLGLDLDAITKWAAIPPVPTDVFKSELPICCFPPHQAERIFLTSGTTADVRGRHFLRDVALYRHSVRAGWTNAGLPDCANAWFLAPRPDSAPESSLACMFETLCPDQNPDRWLLDRDGRFHLAALAEAASRTTPVVLFSTALNLLRLASEHPDGIPLPAGSRVFQTGGYKGLSHEVTPETVYDAIGRSLGVPADHVINEYGMTELCSQAYAIGAGTPHHLPPWMRVQVIDPHTNAPLPNGESGYLVFHDLANLHSVLSIRTQDFGRCIDDGAFFLEGRDTGAIPRGCSRGSDALTPDRS